MCKFFSAISNGKGDVKFFTVEQVVGLIAEGNPKNYNPNSHTSIADFNGIKGSDEDKWNKWEYDTIKKELVIDSKVTTDDSEEVKKKIEDYLAKKNLQFLNNLYGCNSGNRNSGNWNSGNCNSGYWNSGNWNSGDRNSGNWNSGDRNSGNCNSGYWNSGNWNSGDRNSGNWNSGNRNSGNWNSGNCNSGYWNSGNWNSGNWNSGNRNSGNSNSGNRNSGNSNSGTTQASFCSKQQYFLFNKKCTETEYKKIYNLSWSWFGLIAWVCKVDMSEEEKTKYPNHETTGGYLKVFSYKEAWSKCPKEFLDEIKKLKNFSKKTFFEITGLKV